MKTNRKLLRPYNFPAKTTPGFGYYKTQVNNINIAVINIMGVSYLESLKCPFESLEEAVSLCRECPIKIVDVHAETTAEKLALSYFIDGKISAIFPSGKSSDWFGAVVKKYFSAVRSSSSAGAWAMSRNSEIRRFV